MNIVYLLGMIHCAVPNKREKIRMKEQPFIPKTQRVYVLSDNKDPERNDLCFMVSEHDKGSTAYTKRISTAERWIGNQNHTVETIDNVPRCGFEITKKQRRYSTSNVVWRVRHPLGHIFEISSENLDEIFENCNILKGIIQEELFFDSTGFLMNENFDLYKEKLKVIKKKEALKIYAPSSGDIVDIKKYDFSTNSEKYVYLERVHVLFRGKDKSDLVHVFQNCNTNKLKYYKRLDELISISDESIGRPSVTKEQTSKLVNAELENNETEPLSVCGTRLYSTDIVVSSVNAFSINNLTYSMVKCADPTGSNIWYISWRNFVLCDSKFLSLSNIVSDYYPVITSMTDILYSPPPTARSYMSDYARKTRGEYHKAIFEVKK